MPAMAEAVATGVTKRDRLAQRRKALGLTQEALAGLLGVERSTVVRWERGETKPARLSLSARYPEAEALTHPGVCAKLAGVSERRR
jgi:transcriptional regulator with XRE-family HTH domain